MARKLILSVGEPVNTTTDKGEDAHESAGEENVDSKVPKHNHVHISGSLTDEICQAEPQSGPQHDPATPADDSNSKDSAVTSTKVKQSRRNTRKNNSQTIKVQDDALNTPATHAIERKAAIQPAPSGGANETQTMGRATRSKIKSIAQTSTSELESTAETTSINITQPAKNGRRPYSPEEICQLEDLYMKTSGNPTSTERGALAKKLERPYNSVSSWMVTRRDGKKGTAKKIKPADIKPDTSTKRKRVESVSVPKISKRRYASRTERVPEAMTSSSKGSADTSNESEDSSGTSYVAGYRTNPFPLGSVKFYAAELLNITRLQLSSDVVSGCVCGECRSVIRCQESGSSNLVESEGTSEEEKYEATKEAERLARVAEEELITRRREILAAEALIAMLEAV